MTCYHCKKPIAGFIEDHICKGERVDKIDRFGMLILNDNDKETRWCKSSDVDNLEKENEELREALEAIVSCIGNPRTGMYEIIDYSYKTAMEALGRKP